MLIQVVQKDIVKQLINQKTIDYNKISPSLGINVKLTNSQDLSKYFVGTVISLTPAIKNADGVGIYSSFKLEGVNEMGNKKSITVTLDDLESDLYEEYNKMYYVSNIQNTTGAIIYDEEDNSLINDNASVYVFDMENIKIGNLITYKQNSESDVINGVISSIDNKNDRIIISSLVGNRINNVILTLIDVTTSEFKGAVLATEYL